MLTAIPATKPTGSQADTVAERAKPTAPATEMQKCAVVR